MYAFPCAEVIGNRPGKSVEIMPFKVSNFTASIPTKCPRSMLPRGGSNGGSASIDSCIMSSVDTLADGRIPFLIRCIWPMVVMFDFGKCFLTAAVVRPGHELNQSFEIAFIHVTGGSDPTQACRYDVSLGMVF